MRRLALLLVVGVLLPVAPLSYPAQAVDPVPGMWATTDTSDVAADSPEWDDVDWTAAGDQPWPGPRNLRAQWFKIFGDDHDPDQGNWDYGRHVKGEPPHNTYYLWRGAEAFPEGTKLLLEWDFPHARFFDVQVSGLPGPGQSNKGDGSGAHEVPIVDIDIEPDPGSVNPFRVGADRNAANRHFHLTYELRSSGDMNALNTFEGASAVLPPYRAPGNLRVANTGLDEDGGALVGPYFWIRMYLPDGLFDGEYYGGVEPPVLRIDIPDDGRGPFLAPPTRRAEYNYATRVQHDQPYTIQENPVLPNTSPDPNPLNPFVQAYDHDRSTKELEALNFLHAFGQDEVAGAGQTGASKSIDAHRKWNDPEGNPRLENLHGYNYWFLFHALGSGAGACSAAPGTAESIGYGPRKREPGDPYHPGGDAHTSGFNMYNSYLGTRFSIDSKALVAVTGKLPSLPRTLGGGSSIVSDTDLRYMSFGLLTGSVSDTTTVGDLLDEHIITDADGNYLIVYSPTASRPSGASAANGVTWRPWNVGRDAFILVRMATTKSTWAPHPMNIKWEDMPNYALAQNCLSAGRMNDNALALKARMGAYYPKMRYVSPADLSAAISSGAWKQPTWNPKSPYKPLL